MDAIDCQELQIELRISEPYDTYTWPPEMRNAYMGVEEPDSRINFLAGVLHERRRITRELQAAVKAFKDSITSSDLGVWGLG